MSLNDEMARDHARDMNREAQLVEAGRRLEEAADYLRDDEYAKHRQEIHGLRDQLWEERQRIVRRWD